MAEAAPPQNELYYKVIVVGDNGVGKTSFIKKLVHGAFTMNYKATIGVDFSLKVFHVGDDTIVRLQLYDIAGQERFGHMTRVYYKEAYAALVVMDASRELEQSFEDVLKWKRDIDRKVYIPGTTEPIPTVLLVNKADLAADVSKQKIQAFCDEHKFVKYFLTSAKDGMNVEESGQFLVDHIMTIDTQDAEAQDTLNLGQGGKSGGCCG